MQSAPSIPSPNGSLGARVRATAMGSPTAMGFQVRA